jgi:general stress protein 26
VALLGFVATQWCGRRAASAFPTRLNRRPVRALVNFFDSPSGCLLHCREFIARRRRKRGGKNGRGTAPGTLDLLACMISSTNRIWEIIEGVSICMLTTRRANGALRACPLEARPDRSDNCIYFVTDYRSAKEHEIEIDPNVGLIFIDARAKAYLSITAQAKVFQDASKAKELWRLTDTMWWEGPDDPNVCVIRAELLCGEIWDGPATKAVEVFEFLKARMTGQKPNLGENRKTSVRFNE